MFTRRLEPLMESCSFTVNSVVTVLKAEGNVRGFQPTVKDERSLGRSLGGYSGSSGTRPECHSKSKWAAAFWGQPIFFD